MSKIGFLLAGIYLALAVLLISTQGIFGESFIVIILGLPWSLIPSFFEFGNVASPLVYLMVLIPLAVNAAILYGIGHGLSALYARSFGE